VSDHPPISNRYFVTGAEIQPGDVRQITVTLVATGPFDYSEMIPLLNGRHVAIIPADWPPTSSD
jgi:hypothetical protein